MMNRSEIVEKYAAQAVDSMALEELVSFAMDTIISSLDNRETTDQEILEEIYSLECCGDNKLFEEFCYGLLPSDEVQSFLETQAQ